jgi:hypothetical protein
MRANMRDFASNKPGTGGPKIAHPRAAPWPWVLVRCCRSCGRPGYLHAGKVERFFARRISIDKARHLLYESSVLINYERIPDDRQGAAGRPRVPSSAVRNPAI